MKLLYLVFSLVIICSTLVFFPFYSHASGDFDSLEATFNELCSQTENAEALSVDEITSMIARCGSLKEKITTSSHPKKKVLLFRLEKCRNFLEFILQTKELNPPAD